MINFNFQNPAKIIFGKGQIAKVGQEIKAFKARNVLIVAGGGSIKKNGIYEAVVSSLKDSGISWKEIWGVKPNPRLDKVREGAEICKQENIDFILAIGGGSVIDTAKAVAIGAADTSKVSAESRVDTSAMAASDPGKITAFSSNAGLLEELEKQVREETGKGGKILCAFFSNGSFDGIHRRFSEDFK